MLIIDVGNSKVKVAQFEGENIEKRFTFDTERCLEHRFLRREVLEKVDEDIIVFSSVLPEITKGIVSLAQEMEKEFFDISKSKKKILKINYKVEQLGSDRLANAVAAYKKYNPPLLVIDFGTATTYDVVLKDGTLDGGIIAPGIKTCIDFLIKNTGLLPEIPLKYPDAFLGHTTVDALVSGFYYTFSGQMKEVMAKVKERIGDSYRVIGTGGLVDFAQRGFPEMIPDKDLTLLGIKILYEVNSEE